LIAMILRSPRLRLALLLALVAAPACAAARESEARALLQGTMQPTRPSVEVARAFHLDDASAALAIAGE